LGGPGRSGGKRVLHTATLGPGRRGSRGVRLSAAALEIEKVAQRRTERSEAGDYLFVPEGGIHAFCNELGVPASMLILFAPGAPREGYFEGLAEIAQGKELSQEERAEFYLRHDNHWL